jgi:hypothetical protein
MTMILDPNDESAAEYEEDEYDPADYGDPVDDEPESKNGVIVKDVDGKWRPATAAEAREWAEVMLERGIFVPTSPAIRGAMSGVDG